MKKQYRRNNAVAAMASLCLGIICLLTTSNAATNKTDVAAGGANDGASLLVTRSASVGSGIAVDLSVDGKLVATLTNGRSYRGTLAPGKHALSIVAHPNLTGEGPNKVEVTAEKGKAYSFIVNGKNGKIVLAAKA